MGYNYGAGEHERVRKIYKTSMVLIFAIMAAGTILCLAIPGSLIGLFTSNPDTINEGETALRIISAGFIVSTVSVTSAGALEGLGKGFPSLIISVCRYVAVIIPVAFVMSRITGAVGVWHAFWIPLFIIYGTSELVTPISIRSAISLGTIISSTTSTPIHISASHAYFLYSFI